MNSIFIMTKKKPQRQLRLLKSNGENYLQALAPEAVPAAQSVPSPLFPTGALCPP